MNILTKEQLSDYLAGKSFTMCCDNRFAVIQGTHFDLTDYEFEGVTPLISIITVYDATDCSNMSDAGPEYMREDEVKTAFVFYDQPGAAVQMFKDLIANAI